MDNAMERGKHTLLDCGYVNHPKTREHVDQLQAFGIGKKNVEIVYVGRVLVRIPPTLVTKVLKAFPEITEGETYSWCTHSWKYENFSSLEYACR